MTVYKAKNGKWYCRFKIHGEQKHLLCQGATNKADARAIEDAEKFKLRKVQAGLTERDLKSVQVAYWISEYNKYSARNKKSYKTDESRAKKIESFFGKSILIKDIQPEKIEKFKQHLLEMDLSKATVNRYLEQLGSMFSFALTNNWVKENPCKKVKKFPNKNYVIRYLTQEEEKRLFQYLPTYLKPIVLMALKTGLRKSNILQMTWEQVDFNLNRIKVPENKGNKDIILPIVEPLLTTLKEMYEEDNQGYIFKNPETDLPFVDIKKAFNNAVKSAGIENFRFHDLRHTVGTRLAENNVPVNVIKEILAHSDIRTTMRYVHLTDDSKTNALDCI